VGIATIIGMLIGLGAVCYGCMGEELQVSSLKSFVDVVAIVLIVGGAASVVLIGFSMKQVLALPAVLMVTIKAKTESPVDLINKLVQFAEIARRDGILALEGVTESVKDPFLVRGIQLAVDGTDPELIEKIMSTELDNLTDRHNTQKRMVDKLTLYTPAWGLAATVIGLILMFKALKKDVDPGEIGKGFAIALTATMYGVLGANALFGPLGDKLLAIHEEEMLIKNIIVRGVLAIQSGDNPRIVEQKLRVFLPPKLRATESTT
jgi:chemotaxis protein MotA